MNAITQDQLVVIANTLMAGVLVCAVLGWWVGGVLSWLTREGVFLFLRRSPRWRRFRRADARLAAKARREAFAVVLTLRKSDARMLLGVLTEGWWDYGKVSQDDFDSLCIRLEQQCARWGLA